MLTWVEPFIWTVLGWIGNAMMLIGLLGLIAGGIAGLYSLTEWILEKEM